MRRKVRRKVEQRACAYCGGKYWIEPMQHRKVYCCGACRTAAWRVAKEEAEREAE